MEGLLRKRCRSAHLVVEAKVFTLSDENYTLPEAARIGAVSSKPARKGRELVRTVLEVNNISADNVSLDYLLQETDGKWRIVNVVANGVSDLSLKRADYGAVIKSQGFDSLVVRLNDQIADLESEN